ncbi:phage tail length tape measure family protein [uncultured Phenylobacterium sp.]|uniref:phage tail length tape measure family protein n=1 Tax=uncultured Phenylobacterium sp. TaxID=349273 RepID=UPI0025DE1C06|nr:phage tail length tape measure family protein [uncultured Phenylobacterium sp.]
MATGNATIAALKVSLGLDSAQFETGLRDASATMQRESRKQAAAAQSLERRIFALKSAMDPAWAAQQRLNTEMKEAADLYKLGAISASDYAKRVGQLDQAMAAAARGHVGLANAQGVATKSSKVLQQAGLNLSRQFADVGVSLAGGASAGLVLIQQGPQIADAFAQAKTQGAGFGAVIKGLGASIAPFAPALAAVGGAAAVTFGVAGLAARALNKDSANAVKSLGLTEDQLKRLKKQGVDTGVTIGDVFRGTFNYLKGAVGPILAPIGKFFGELLDGITKGLVTYYKTIVGGFRGAFEAVKATWKLLPAALGDATISATNAVLKATTAMINGIIAKYNELLPIIRTLLSATGNRVLAAGLRPGQAVSAPQLANPFAGSAAGAAQAAQVGFQRGFAAGSADVDKVLGGLAKSILGARRARVLKAAGEADKGGKAGGSRTSTPRDTTDEREAQIAAQLAQAAQDELQARLALVREVGERLALEKQILAAELKEQQARVDAQIAAIADDKGLDDVAKQLRTADLERLKLQQARTAGLKEQALDERAAAEIAREAAETQQAGLANEIDLLGAQADTLKSAFARALAGQKILAVEHELELAKVEEVIRSKTATREEIARAESRKATLLKLQDIEKTQAKEQTRLVNAIQEAADGALGFRNAIKRHDWAAIFTEFQRTIETIQAAFASQGLTGGLLTAGSAAAQLIGGKTGRIAGNALGIAGLGLSTGAFAASTAGAAALGAAGLSSAAIAGLAAAAPPLAAAAAVLYAAAKLFNIGGKPSNKGAGFDLVTGAISGNKRDQETENAARSAGEAIRGIQDALKGAGIGLTDAITGLVIGTRDQTQIYLQSGKTLRSAVGDGAAAVDTALRALLEGATYVSAAQKKLVDSALATGKGFDAIIEVLSSYEAAQKLSGRLADQILQLTDPKAYDLEGVKRAIDEQKAAYAELAAEGYLTAEQLATINGQLATLQGLQIDEVLKRYAENIATIEPPAVNDNSLDFLGDVARTTADGLRDAYDAFASAKREEIDGLRAAAAGLDSFLRELKLGPVAGRNPVAQLEVLRGEFKRLSALPAANPERLANLQGVAQAFVEASRAASPDELSFRRDLNAVQREVTASRDAAEAQADIGQAQLDAQTAMLTQLGVLTLVTKDMAAALKDYLVAQKNLQTAGGAPINFDAARYAAVSPDLVENFTSGGSLRSAGKTLEEALLAHYLTTGIGEIASGGRRRGFATGGSFRVGGHGGIDNQLMQFWASPGEMVSVTHGDPQAGVGEGLRQIDRRLGMLEIAEAKSLGYLRRMEKVFTKWDGDGLPAERNVA